MKRCPPGKGRMATGGIRSKAGLIEPSRIAAQCLSLMETGGWDPAFNSIGDYAQKVCPSRAYRLMDELRKRVPTTVQYWENQEGRTKEDVLKLLGAVANA